MYPIQKELSLIASQLDKIGTTKEDQTKHLNDCFIKELQQAGILKRYDECNKKIRTQWFFQPYGIHGIAHTRRVLFLTLLIAYNESISDTDTELLCYAAMLHDVGRTNDYYDLAHGMKSWQKIEKLQLLKKIFFEEKRELLKVLIVFHAINDDIGLKKIQESKLIQNKDLAICLFRIFKDADNLDRVRLGDFNKEFLRTNSSMSLVSIAEELYTQGDWN